jgi:hypothetical protein
MAEEIRIIRGDTEDFDFQALDDDGNPLALSGVWSIWFDSDLASYNSIDDPEKFIIETSPYTTGQGVFTLESIETDPDADQQSYDYKIKVFKNDDPLLVKTISSGRLIFVDEA